MWLHYIPGIVFRTNNEPFKNEMQKFTSKIVEMAKEAQLFYWQGGPIILAQIENEYGNVAYSYGAPGKAYTKWAAMMAVGLNTGVPWVMCQQPDAPDPVINTCNGFYCDGFTPNSYGKPTIWTENWSGWFHSFGRSLPHRPAQDLAFAVARFYERGGTFQNYYMYHGGTNFERTSGGPFISTSYDYDAPIDEYGDVRQPKWGHLKDLHQAIKLCEPALVLQDPTTMMLGSQQEGHIYTNGKDICAAFLANIDNKADATVHYNGQSYHLPAWSVSILPDCKNVVYNTAQINAQTSMMTNSVVARVLEAAKASLNVLSGLVWETHEEPIGSWGNNSFTATDFLDQINTTKDTTDYLWYSTSVELDGDEGSVKSGSTFSLSLHSLGHAVHVFVNGELSGSGSGDPDNSTFYLETPVALKSGHNDIALLSMTVGLQNVGAFYESWGAGIDGPVMIKGLRSGIQDLSSQMWTYQIGLQGEELGLNTATGGSSMEWTPSMETPQHKPMTWYKATFDAPQGSDPLALDLSSMGKGQAWVNGEGIGRYWPTDLAPQAGCSSTCDYRGAYSDNKCFTECGQSSQARYHVPRSWLKPTGNVLVLFEEIGGDPTQISFITSSATSVCAYVSESHPPPVPTWDTAKSWKDSKPEIRLDCGSGKMISGIKFASYGNPQGKCGSFRQGTCHAASSVYTVKKACVGQSGCSVIVSNNNFNQDPCAKVVKSLAVEALCSPAL